MSGIGAGSESSRVGPGSILGIAAVACAACCIAPILGVVGTVAALGVLSTMFVGVAGLLVAGVAVAPFSIAVRRRSSQAASSIAPEAFRVSRPP
jgi:hypothetical protein